MELIAVDPEGGRSILLLDGADPRSWRAESSDRSLGPFTAPLAIHADRYSNEAIADLARRLLERGLGYLCAWGPGCERVHALFDAEYVGDGSAEWGRVLMTTDHREESLAEALWFGIDVAIHEDVRDVRDSPAVVGVDDPDWLAEILARVADLAELRRHVVEDLGSSDSAGR